MAAPAPAPTHPKPETARAGYSACAVVRITLTRFRNYGHARLEARALPVVLTGPNGAGKTNLLEAISFLAPGRGLRGARLKDVELRRPADSETIPSWAVAATIAGKHGSAEIGTGGSPEPDGSDRRTVRIDGRSTRAVALADHVSMLWLTPAMDRLFLEAASGRRRFLDRLVFAFDPAHAGRVARYEQAMRERARLLRDGIRDDGWLGGLETLLATTGVAVAAARLDLVERLRAALRSMDGPFPRADLALTGTAERDLREQPALAVEDRLRDALRSARRKDAESGNTAIGPHRTDLEVRYHGQQGDDARGMPAALCSTGEQKALLISIILAHGRLIASDRSLAPILLLDEIAAHLDPNRRAALFEAITGIGCQAWLTGTDAALFSPLRGMAGFIRVEGGSLLSEP